ncbi:hypothetical protein OUZ56_002039 [Daphnia magna]|uniref:Uncharacterized protein n=1 Tax=Daphnia magna TaxID=35525 RepID=A0ABR0A4H5_9CRUS|nr:hypothetical protein OUZ56_002039 [Daphnia magna]
MFREEQLPTTYTPPPTQNTLDYGLLFKAVRMESPDASAVRRVVSETDAHCWVRAEPHPGV